MFQSSSRGDDYIEKTFGIGELTARISTALRHSLRREGSKASSAIDGLLFDVVKRLVIHDGMTVRLPLRGYDLLPSLAKHAGRAGTHRPLMRRSGGRRMPTIRTISGFSLAMFAGRLRVIRQIRKSSAPNQAWDIGSQQIEPQQSVQHSDCSSQYPSGPCTPGVLRAAPNHAAARGTESDRIGRSERSLATAGAGDLKCRRP